MSPSESNAKTAQLTIAAMEKRIKELEAERTALIAVARAAKKLVTPDFQESWPAPLELDQALSNLPKGILE